MLTVVDAGGVREGHEMGSDRGKCFFEVGNTPKKLRFFCTFFFITNFSDSELENQFLGTIPNGSPFFGQKSVNAS